MQLTFSTTSLSIALLPRSFRASATKKTMWTRVVTATSFQLRKIYARRSSLLNATTNFHVPVITFHLCCDSIEHSVINQFSYKLIIHQLNIGKREKIKSLKFNKFHKQYCFRINLTRPKTIIKHRITRANHN
jgi:hypothetical protein